MLSTGYFFDGRKGDFLVYEFSDPTGASSLRIFDVRSGRELFADGLEHLVAVRLAQGVLQLRYVRGINASCSLLLHPGSCWSELLASGQIPGNAFAEPPSADVCNNIYGPESYPSELYYEVALTLDTRGEASERRLSPLGCYPQP